MADWNGLGQAAAAMSQNYQMNRIIDKAEADLEEEYLATARFMFLDAALIEFVINNYSGSERQPRIIFDSEFRDSLAAIGEQVFRKTRTWAAVQKAAKEYPIAPGPDLYRKHVTIAIYNEEVTKANTLLKQAGEREAALVAKVAKYEAQLKAANAATAQVKLKLVAADQDIEVKTGVIRYLKATLKTETKNSVMHLAQAAAFRQQLTMAEPSNPMVTDSDLRQRVSETAYALFEQSDFTDWNGVRELGRTFVSPNERLRALEGAKLSGFTPLLEENNSESLEEDYSRSTVRAQTSS